MLSFALLNKGDELTEIQWMTTFFMIFPLFSFLWNYQEVIHYNLKMSSKVQKIMVQPIVNSENKYT